MLKIGTRVKTADNSGALSVQIFAIYGGSRKKSASAGDKVRVSVKVAKPNGSVKKHEVIKAVVVRTKKLQRRDDGSYIRFDENAVVLLDGDTSNPKGTRVFGPVARELKVLGYEKIVYLAPEVL